MLDLTSSIFDRLAKKRVDLAGRVFATSVTQLKTRSNLLYLIELMIVVADD